MSLQDMQDEVHKRIQSVGVTYFDEMTNLGQLMEEVGEMSRIMIREYGEQSRKKGSTPEDLGSEIADVMFVLVCIANQTGVTLEDVWEKGMNKRNTRDKERHWDNEKLTSKV